MNNNKAQKNMLKSGLITSRKGAKVLVFIGGIFARAGREFASSGLMDPEDEQLQQCRFMLSMGGFRLVLSYGLTCKNAAVLKQEIWQKYKMKHKELPPT